MFKLDQKGMSLPIVLAVAAIIGANTYYFMTTQKNASVTTALVKTDITEDAEKRRVASVLSDFNVCTANFGGLTMSTLKTPDASGVTSITKSGTTIIKVGTNFTTATGSPAFNSNVDHSTPQTFQESSRVSRIYFSEIPPTNPAIPSVPPQQVRVTLRIELETLASTAVGSAGKKTKLIAIPLYVDFDSYPANVPSPDTRKVVRCYARPDTALGQSGLFEAMKAACLTNNTSTNKLTVAGCEHILKPLDCGPAKNKFLDSVGLAADNAIVHTCNIFQTNAALMISNCTLGQTAQAIVNSSLQCAYPDACSTGARMGSALIKNASASVYSCLESCNSTDVWHSTNASGDGGSTCYPRLYTCASGYYAKTVSADGTVDCQPITTKNKACAANQFATHFDTLSTTGNLLHCAAFTKSRTCASSPKFSYLTGLSSDPPPCTTLN